MQLYDFNSPRFIDSFPRCADGSVIAKYTKLLAQLFPGQSQFFLLLNPSGELFLHVSARDFQFEHPDVLLYQLANGSDLLITDKLWEVPFQGIFSAATEQFIGFFLCCRLKTAEGRLIGCFGVLSHEQKVVLPDEKVFVQWVAESIVHDVSGTAETSPDAVACSEIQQLIVPYLDDVYLLVDEQGTITNFSEQLPAELQPLLFKDGHSLSLVFGEQISLKLIELIQLCALTNKKQTDMFNMSCHGLNYLFSVSCSRFEQSNFLLTFHDVTERNRLREMLENRKQLLEHIVQAGNMGILVLENGQDVQYYNKPIADWFGIHDNAAVQKLPLEHWDENIKDSFEKSPFKQLFQLKKDIKDAWYPFFTANGDLKTFSINAVFHQIGSSNNAKGTFFLQDVTERALLEQTMIEMEQQMQFLLQSSPVVIYQMLLHPYHQFTYVSPNCEEILGYSQAFILNDPSFWQRHLHPEDKDQISTFTSSENVQNCEYRLWSARLGCYRWIKDIRRMSTEKDGYSWIGGLLDITERKHAEQQRTFMQEELAATLTSLVDAVITIDGHGMILDFNPATCRMFGYSAEQLRGQSVSKLMPWKTAQHHTQSIETYIRTREPHAIGSSREVQAMHAQGHEFPIAISVAVIGEGDNLRFVGCCHDLSEIKKQQEQLIHSEKLGAVGKLTSSIAHDFNNILGIVRGYAEMLQHEGAHVEKLALPIIEASDRASLMISQLLDFSSSKQRLLTHIQLNEHLTKLKPLLEKSLAATVRLELDLHDQPLGVRVELTAFDNLMINMAVNANHAMNEHGTLQIRTELCDSHALPKELSLKLERYVKISIIDDGCGMSEEVRKKIFEPFFTTKGDKGTGLGLAQAYGMIHRCGGVIDVKTAEGKGTSFYLYLPEEPLSDYQPHADSLATRKPHTQRNLQPMTKTTLGAASNRAILLVDDEMELLEMNAMLLESAGYQVYKANNASEAFEILRKFPITLLLSDIMMPQMNGLELAKQIKADYPLIKIQMISGFAENVIVEDEQSMAWYTQKLSKPVPMTVLLKRVNELLSV